MAKPLNLRQIDVLAFARSGALVEEAVALQQFSRLASDVLPGQTLVHWSAQGQLRADANSTEVPWLQLRVSAQLSLQCQRCLAPVSEQVDVDRWFRFVADEASAEREDQTSDEDLLVLSRQFDLFALVEDELLMALPLVPRHAQCGSMPVHGLGAELQDPGPHPFEGLAALKH